MESSEKFEDALSYMDQCKVICLGYISAFGKIERKSGQVADPDTISSLCSIADQELSGFGDEDELQSFVSTAVYLAEEQRKTDTNGEKLGECVNTLQSFLTQEVFDECANELAQPPIESWEKVRQVLHLVYKACVSQNNKLGVIIDYGVRYMRKTTTEFVGKQGGWRVLGGGGKVLQKPDDSSISSSMVVVEHESTQDEINSKPAAAGDAEAQGKETTPESEGSSQHRDEPDLKEDSVLKSPENRTPIPLSPLNTPPYSFPSSVTTDEERESLATPPELVERPQMTESYLQAMGERETRRISSASGNGFEIIDSENGGAEDPIRSTQNIDDVQAFQPRQETEEHTSSTSTATGQVPQETEPLQGPAESAKEGSLFGGYLPHISIGVAAAAAVAGIFVLKKNM